ncbi:hypothetical protein [Desulfobacula sp.]|uniref:hypothetical protein n=1 Tax=Desulfobacula sp. TaxID=2593537 RepID=UPI0026268CA5|nr:hypothetical protein [Desulfobacula sp.]
MRFGKGGLIKPSTMGWINAVYEQRDRVTQIIEFGFDLQMVGVFLASVIRVVLMITLPIL